MNCLIVSVDCQVHLFEVLLLSIDGLMTVLKSPPIMIGPVQLVEMVEKKLLKKDGSSVFGP